VPTLSRSPASSVPEGGVICFEPTDVAFRKLVANVRLNPDLAARMTLALAMLVGGRNSTVPERLFSSWPLASGDDRHALHGGRPMTTREARATTLDAAPAEAGVDRRGCRENGRGWVRVRCAAGRREDARQRPPILMELAPYVLDETGASIEELVGILADAGYTLAKLGSGRRIRSTERPSVSSCRSVPPSTSWQHSAAPLLQHEEATRRRDGWSARDEAIGTFNRADESRWQQTYRLEPASQNPR